MFFWPPAKQTRHTVLDLEFKVSGFGWNVSTSGSLGYASSYASKIWLIELAFFLNLLAAIVGSFEQKLGYSSVMRGLHAR